MDTIRSYVYPVMLSVCLLWTVFTSDAQTDVVYETGKTSFRKNCGSCHAVHQEVYGPMLASISKKKERNWLISFIKNSQTVIRSGDAYAALLFEKFNNQVMPPFEQLSDKEIDAILHYIEVESLHPSQVLNDTDISSVTNSNVLDGKREFLEHCSMCHFVHKESYFAPALGSVSKRHSRTWLISFIQNSQKKIREKDAYAVHIYKAFDGHVMTRMDFLAEEEINSILDYIEFESTVNAAYKSKKNNKIYAQQSINDIAVRLNLCEWIALVFVISTLLIMILYYCFLIRMIRHIKINKI